MELPDDFLPDAPRTHRLYVAAQHGTKFPVGNLRGVEYQGLLNTLPAVEIDASDYDWLRVHSIKARPVARFRPHYRQDKPPAWHLEGTKYPRSWTGSWTYIMEATDFAIPDEALPISYERENNLR